MALAEAHREAVLGHAQPFGVPRLLMTFPAAKGKGLIGGGAPKSMRERLHVALQQTVPAWWQPEVPWSHWPGALAKALPGLLR